MLRPRIIPCLLVHNGGLVKTRQFSDTTYVGDPLNAVRIFNEKEVDEFMVIDIDATVKGHEPDYELIAQMAAECRMPLTYGGGVNKVGLNIDSGLFTLCYETSNPNNGASSPFPRIRVL